MISRLASELLPVVDLQLAHERLQITFDDEAFAEPRPIDQREARLSEQRPALAEKRAVGFDEHGLNRCARYLCDQREAALEVVHRAAPGAGSLGEYQQRP